MLGAMVIDDNGETWPMEAVRLRGILADRAADTDIVAHAVRHRGFVLLRRQGRMVRADMRPALVKPATLIALYYNLLDLRPQQIVLSRLAGDGASHELFDDVSEFAATVERDIDDEGVQRHRPLYMASPRPLAHLHRPRYARLGQVVALWRASRGRMPDNLLVKLRGFGVQLRVALSRNPANTHRLVYEHLGSGYSFVSEACLPLLLIGQDIEMLPDRDFGAWATASYHECRADDKPRLQTVSAVIRRGDGQRIWSYYDRVLLPWRDGDGTRFVLGASEVRRQTRVA